MTGEKHHRRGRGASRWSRIASTVSGLAGCLVWGGLLFRSVWVDWPSEQRLPGALLLGLFLLCLLVVGLCGVPLLGARRRPHSRAAGADHTPGFPAASEHAPMPDTDGPPTPSPRTSSRGVGRGSATVLGLALLGAMLGGCERKELCYPEPSRPLVVYLALDNDLAGEQSARLNALRAGWRSDMDVWVYADTPSGASLSHLEGTASGVELRTVETYGEENSASGSTLERVLRSVWQRSPSEGYGLLFFSHATGWLPEGALARPHAEAASVASGAGGGATRTLGRDGSAEMSLEAFAAAIPEGMPLDYILFEACLVAGAEVALELCGRTDLLLVSSAELLVPGFRPLYGECLELLTSRRLGTEELLTTFGQRYMRYVRQECAGIYRSATLSVIRTSSLPALASAVHRATGGRAGEMASEELLSQLQHFDRPGQYGDRPAAARFFDLEDYVERLHAASGADMASLAAFRAALEDAVVWSDATEQFMGGAGAPYGGFDIARHGGLTTYVPRAEFPSLNEAYRQTAWYRAITTNAL